MTYRTGSVLTLAAVAFAISTGAARADLELRDVVGVMVKGAAAFAVEAGLQASEEIEGTYVLGKGYVDPDRYAQSIEPPYSPMEGVFCYADQQLCFGKDGTISPDWTQKTYGN